MNEDLKVLPRNFICTKFLFVICSTAIFFLKDISETDSEQEMSNLPVLSTKNEQSLTNITSSTLEESKQDYNNNDSSKQATNATITAPVLGTSVYGMPTMGYFNNVSEPNNNNTVQSNGPQRIGPYYLGPTLGRGNFAVVKLGKHSQLSVKVILSSYTLVFHHSFIEFLSLLHALLYVR